MCLCFKRDRLFRNGCLLFIAYSCFFTDQWLGKSWGIFSIFILVIPDVWIDVGASISGPTSVFMYLSTLTPLPHTDT